MAVLAAHAIALPLSPPFPAPELQYILSHSQATLLLHSPKYASKVDEVLTTPSKELDVTPSPTPVELPKRLGAISETFEPIELVEEDNAEGAGMMLYTSGTTNRPKGVLLPESAQTAQAQALIAAWNYSPSDRLLHVLPLHHIHGTVNAVLTPLFAGSSIEFLFPFNADAVWRRFASPFLDSPETLAAAVKTIGVSQAVKASAITNGVVSQPPKPAKPVSLTNGFVHPVKTNGFHPPTPEVNGPPTPVTETNGTNTPAPELNGFGHSSEISRLAAVISHLAAEVNNLAAKISQPQQPQPAALTNGLNHAISQQTNGVPPTPALSTGVNTPLASTNGFTTPIAETPSAPVAVKAPEAPKAAADPAEDKYKNMSRVKITFFTVVPTVYTRLLATHKALPPSVAEAGRVAISPAHMRVSISGSAALPTPVKRAWKDLSRGNVLLERYGMTEVGMALSCGLDYADRVDGSVGWPLPGVEARLVDTETGAVVEDVDPSSSADAHADAETAPERSGEIQLRGANVFAEYWANPAATSKEFVPADDGRGPWFKTGDVAVRRPVPAAGHGASGAWAQGPMYFILGRQSADIIKSGGEKVSALEVERELLSLPEVSECAVVAVPSGKWGQKVGAVVIHSAEHLAHGPAWRPLDMRRALKGRLATYKIPQVLRVVDHIPRNAMGKINKKDLLRKVFLDDFSGDEM